MIENKLYLALLNEGTSKPELSNMEKQSINKFGKNKKIFRERGKMAGKFIEKCLEKICHLLTLHWQLPGNSNVSLVI